MIQSQETILPAMQRNFVWPEDKIYHLFDSLMRDYPIGTFLFWDIKKDIFGQYAFNQFISEVDDKKGSLQRGEAVTADYPKYTAVLDGQQRITSICVGVLGKWHTRKKGKPKADPNSYYDRFLALDILAYPETDEDEYAFKFVPQEELETDFTDPDGIRHFWVPVSTVFKEDAENRDGFDPSDYMDDFSIKHPGILNDEQRKKRRKMLETLKYALREKKTINYYEAKNKSLAEVIEIFVRVNSGGQKLSASDLMLSIASGTLGSTDVHVKMQEAIDLINDSVKDVENGFKVDKELILVAGLLFTGAKSLSLQKKENYDRSQMDAVFQTNWDNIIAALSNTVQFIEHMGFNGKKLSSKNLILPVAYYFYKNNLGNSYINGTSNRLKCDNIFIRQWMIRAMVNDVFMDGTGSTLLRIRDVIDADSSKHFPLNVLMVMKIKKPLSISSEQVDEIVAYKYGDSRIIPILMDLGCRSTDTYQVDHIWPKSLILTKTAVRKKYPSVSDAVFEEFKSNCHKLGNLQLLSPVQNQLKSDTPFGDWVKVEHPSGNDNYYDNNLIPKGISYDFKDFLLFVSERQKLLKKAVLQAYPDDFSKIVNRYGLQDLI